MPKTFSPSDIQRIAEQMKVEILEDMSAGLVPPTCRSFSELHDHVDANMYADSLIAEPGHGFETWNELANAVQPIVDEWLRNRHADAG